MSSTAPAETFTYREPNKDATETATHVKKDDGTFELATLSGATATHVKVDSTGKVVVGGRRSPRSSRRGGSRASKRGGSRASKRGGRRSNKRGGKRSSRRGGSRASRR